MHPNFFICDIHVNTVYNIYTHENNLLNSIKVFTQKKIDPTPSIIKFNNIKNYSECT